MRISPNHLSSSGNNFAIVRMALAACVLTGHAYWKVTGSLYADDLSSYLGRPLSAYAVDGFFFLSGFLVYASLLRHDNCLQFLMSRLVRIWPGLALSTLATVLAFSPLSKTQGWAYFEGETLRFIASTLSFFGKHYRVTGLPCEDNLCVVNGSLWSIPWEMRCYVVLTWLFCMRLTNHRMMAFVLLPAILIARVLWNLLQYPPLPFTGIWYLIQTSLQVGSMFALGIAAYMARGRIILSWLGALLLLGLTILQNHFHLRTGVEMLFISYTILCAGILTTKHSALAANWRDYSYGIYLYSFPVLMVITHFYSFTNYLALAFINLLATIPLAAFSWHCVEKPAIDALKRWRRRAGAAAN